MKKKQAAIVALTAPRGAATNLRPAGAHLDARKRADRRQAVKSALRQGRWE